MPGAICLRRRTTFEQGIPITDLLSHNTLRFSKLMLHLFNLQVELKKQTAFGFPRATLGNVVFEAGTTDPPPGVGKTFNIFTAFFQFFEEFDRAVFCVVFLVRVKFSENENCAD